MESQSSSICNFYKDKSIFITGATGFMGKVLVEKLLRSCSGINNIYLLLRGKRGVGSRARFEELLDSKIFEQIKNENPKLLSKLIPIQGDITLPGLGLSETDLNTLITEVSIVFHSAATVKFDEPLKTSVQFNLIGTRRLVELCHKIQKLIALVHVSTAYANCDRDHIDEILYQSEVQPNRIIELVKWLDDDLLNAITPKLLGNKPNTYTYTKALAESLLIEESHGLPVAIVRPSIVTAAWHEPMRGWVDNINGMTGLMIASGKGVLRSMLFNSKACSDIIPVDSVINLMIAVAWHTATKTPNNLMIYNCTSGQINKITWGEVERIAFPYLLRYPSEQLYRYPGGRFRESKIINNLYCFFDHTIPAYFFDFFMGLMGRKKIMVKLYQKLHRAITSLEWFTTRDWKFSSNNVLMLIDELDEKDKKIFNFDIRELHWPSYWEDYVVGTRKYVLKEQNVTLPRSRSNLRRIYYIHKIFGFVIMYGIWHMVLMRTHTVKRLWFSLTTVFMGLFNFLLPKINNA